MKNFDLEIINNHRGYFCEGTSDEDIDNTDVYLYLTEEENLLPFNIDTWFDNMQNVWRFYADLQNLNEL